MGQVSILRVDELEAPEQTLRSIAVICYKNAEGDAERATALVVRRLRANPALTQQLLKDIAFTAVQSAVHSIESRERAPQKRIAPRAYDTSGLRSMAVATRNEACLNYVMMDGSRLRDAKKETLIAEMGRHFAQSEVAQNLGQLMRYISRQLEDNKTVGACLSEAKLAGYFAKFNLGS